VAPGRGLALHGRTKPANQHTRAPQTIHPAPEAKRARIFRPTVIRTRFRPRPRCHQPPEPQGFGEVPCPRAQGWVRMLGVRTASAQSVSCPPGPGRISRKLSPSASPNDRLKRGGIVRPERRAPRTRSAGRLPASGRFRREGSAIWKVQHFLYASQVGPGSD
jgi:hypothetical protein